MAELVEATIGIVIKLLSLGIVNFIILQTRLPAKHGCLLVSLLNNETNFFLKGFSLELRNLVSKAEPFAKCSMA